MTSYKMIPLTRDEVFLLISLVESHPEVTSRATSASDNAEKKEAWKKITAQFNAKVTSGPRKPGQLRLKWENLKKAARKRSANRAVDIKAEQTIAEYCRPDIALDRVATILGVTRDVPCGARGDDSSLDVKMFNTFTTDIKVEEVPIHIEPHHPSSPPPSVSSISSVDRMKRRIERELTRSRIARNLAIAEYYKVKTHKMELEIQRIQNEKMKNLPAK